MNNTTNVIEKKTTNEVAVTTKKETTSTVTKATTSYQYKYTPPVFKWPRLSDRTPRNKKLEKIVRKDQKDLKQYCSERLKSMGYTRIMNHDGFLYAKGTVPVMLVAHMDTVHVKQVKDIYYNDGRMYSPEGIGGDDRCGIYMIFEILKELNCSVLFTEDEEIGCVGAGKFVKAASVVRNIYDLGKNFDINYIIEFDRKGSTDAVFYEGNNTDFEEFITTEPDGAKGYFKSDFGSYSDICEIAPAIGVSAVNLSCGYYEAHTINEYIILEEMERVIEEAKKIINRQTEMFEWVQGYSNYGYYGYSTKGRGSYFDYEDYYDDYYNGVYDKSYYNNTPRTTKYAEGEPFDMEAYEDGYEEGYDEGERKGEEIGYQEGWEDGWNEGFKHGKNAPSKGIVSTTTQEWTRIWHILYEDKEDLTQKTAEITALRMLEAIGLFLTANNTYTVKDIISVTDGKAK